MFSIIAAVLFVIKILSICLKVARENYLLFLMNFTVV